ncbi:MAG: DUF1292 domain-containing protein [Clostridiales bacterium]|jgi:uncharacterized protein YrzB (UPF0473 family)|nr:DUF1292 domain-containing protein [Clostridiales bacterium]
MKPDEKKKKIPALQEDIPFEVDILPEDDDEVITLSDDEGNETDFYQVAVVGHGDKNYVLLQPVEPDEEIAEDEVIIFELLDDPDDAESTTFEPVADEALADVIFEQYLRAVADLETDTDDNPAD